METKSRPNTMSFATKFITGGLVAGGVTFFYSNQIQSTTTRLTNDLKSLSQQLTTLSTPPPSASEYPLPVPERLPFSEEVKARWNEKFIYGVTALRETNWPQVASETFKSAKDGAAGLWTKVAGEAEPVVDAVKEEKKLV
ncbi:hypothetical protein MNV49_005868 [Pseudohyphozyma bogoriensis]|nr:hypothetical protein MNV49_005868 [Pseudohyphozyma bogoriensis]